MMHPPNGPIERTVQINVTEEACSVMSDQFDEATDTYSKVICGMHDFIGLLIKSRDDLKTKLNKAADEVRKVGALKAQLAEVHAKVSKATIALGCYAEQDDGQIARECLDAMRGGDE